MYVKVKFDTSNREYVYKTNLKLIQGAKYKIENERGCNYNNSVVTVTQIGLYYFGPVTDFREIVKAECVDAPAPKLLYEIQNIYENYDKGVITVLWTDGTKTILHCDPYDEWDFEKAIGLAFMKKHYRNRGCFNDEIRKWDRILDERYKKAHEKEFKEWRKAHREEE